MAMHSLAEIRAAFLQYFRNQDHQECASSALVPSTDASLMFTNSGMVQFKNIFTGREQAPAARVVTSQKCMRAGGKHNDLENVGHTARHHTFFEMLGNFSFGDYFKEQAIFFAWDFLTKELGLAEERLWVTVYHDDDEAGRLWRKITPLTENRIIRITTSDNFWQMGDTGPCGPCSEIFYDHGENVAGGPPGSPEEDGDRFVEIWNLVFMQYLQEVNKPRRALPHPSIDTGMGLERITAVLQGKHDNYEIDVMRTIIRAVQDLLPGEADVTVSHRVIADHMRAICFLLSEGVMPSNEGRGYVLRRIMRRAMRHAYMLGQREPSLHRLVHVVTNQMDDHYAELEKREAMVKETLLFEETRFGETLQRGLHTLEEACRKLKPASALPASVAFRLYDTYGFPLDLTADILRERGHALDLAEIETLMEKQRTRARKHWRGSGGKESEEIWHQIREETGNSEFLGYESTSLTGRIQVLVQNGTRQERVAAGATVDLVCNQTPFYAESGGQLGDRGKLTTKNGEAQVDDTRNEAQGVIVHRVKITKGSLIVGDSAFLEVDPHYRTSISRHHTLTHLLHASLRNRLGSHVTQSGSWVGAKGLRFDFSHHSGLSEDDIRIIEDEINNQVCQNLAVKARIMEREEAIRQGAMALFGERYRDEVRVVRVGVGDEAVSMELCGGTHVRRTGEIGLGRIISESAIAAGVRRIEMSAGLSLLETMRQDSRTLTRAQSLLRCSKTEVLPRVQDLIAERQSLKDGLHDLRHKLALAEGMDCTQIGAISLLTRHLQDFPTNEIKGLCDTLRAKLGSGVVLLSATGGGKATLLVSVTSDWVSKGLDARELAQAGADVFGTRAGGRANLAQTGGRDPRLLPKALASVQGALKGWDAKNTTAASKER